MAGLGQRLRAESDRPLRDGLAPLAWVLALVNLAVFAGTAAVNPPFLPFASRAFPPYPYRPDRWWIVFTIAAAAIVLGLMRGDRRLALGAALANLGLLVYDALFPASAPGGHLLMLLSFAPGFPAGSQWLAPAVVLVLATAAAPLRRLPPTRVPVAVLAVAALVALSRNGWGHFLFLRWPLAAVLVLAVAFGALVPRLAVVAVGLALAAAPSAPTLLIGANLPHPSVVGLAAVGLVFVPFTRLVRRPRYGDGMTTFDLRTLRLRSGDQARERVEIDLDPLVLGGQTYEPRPNPAPAELTVTRASSGTVLELALDVSLEGPCFRCLSDAELPLSLSLREYEATKPEGEEERTEYLDDDRVDLSGWARDAIALALPDQILCREDCAGLCPVCGKDLNAEPHEHADERTDPRWAALESLRESE